MSEQKKPLGTVSPATSDVTITPHHRVSCDGGGGALGHPKVFMDMGQAGDVQCKYCDHKFVLSDTH